MPLFVRVLARASLFIALVLSLLASAIAHASNYSFGVLSQRSPVLTAEFWNPILDYVSRRSDVRLELKITRTAPESNAAIARGEYDFIYSNTIFLPTNSLQAYRVILRPKGEPIHAQIVTLDASPVRSLADLHEHEVGFPSKAAFVGYAVPMDHLLRQGIRVSPLFGGNQEGIMGQLKAGRVIAAGVNSQVMRAFAARENLSYRVLWQSSGFHNLPIAAHPRVPAEAAEAVRRTLAGMPEDPEGRKILADTAAVIKQQPPFGFMAADQRDYQPYIDFYRHTLVKDIE